MIVLSSPTMTLQAVLAGAVATTEPRCTVCYYDMPALATSDTGAQIPALFNSITTGATPVDICEAYGSTRFQAGARVIKTVKIHNNDTASVQVLVSTSDSVTNNQILVTLATRETLYYEDGRGWYVLDANGAIKTGSLTYTEGSWTPVLTFATAGNLSVVYSTQVGRYIRIGDQVTAFFDLITSTFTHTTASGNAQITGLPFTPENITGFAPRSTLQWSGITKANYTDIKASITPNSTTMTIVASGSGQASSNVAAADMPTTGSVILVGNITFQTT